MKTNRRSFLSSSIAMAMAGFTAPLMALAKPEPIKKGSNILIGDYGGCGWACLVWGGDVDGALKFGNSGEAPLWGDDFRVDLATQCVEFLSFTEDSRCYRATAKLGEMILRSPTGTFYTLPLKVDKWRLKQ